MGLCKAQRYEFLIHPNVENVNIFDMRLHEQVHLEGNTYILKVPGGWLYRFTDPVEGECVNAVFVRDPSYYYS